MIDVRLLRSDPDGVRAALGRRGDAELDALVVRADELDTRLRAITVRRDEIRAQVNELSREVGRLRREGDTASAEAVQNESRDLGSEEAALASEHDSVAADLRELLLVIPNIPSELVPDGASDADNPVVSGPFLPEGGEAAFAEHQRVPHWEIGAEHHILDNERATKIAASMFTMQRGAGATLVRALCQYGLDLNADVHEEIRAPSLVSTATLTATGQLPKFGEDLFKADTGHWLIPTAEVPLTNIIAGHLVEADYLPRRYTAMTWCFRSEAGAAGKDTRGMIRQHQFTKVELVSIAHPDQSDEEHERMTSCAEAVLQRLGLAYRVMLLSSGDMGFSARKTYDLEVWLPGQDTYREISSCSNCGDFPARRMNARYKPEAGGKPEFVHTLNGSGVAVGRCLIAVLENGQQPDGSVALPAALHAYLGGKTTLAADGSLV